MSSISSTAARGAVTLTTAHACLSASAYLVAVLLARGLGPASYGVYGIVYSVLLGVELVGRLGIPQAASKLIAEQKSGARRLEATSISLTAALYLTVFVAFWLLAPQLAKLFQVEDGEALFRLASFDIPFYGLYFICSHILNGRRMFGAESLGLIVYSLSRVVGISILYFTELSVAGALVVNITASVLGLGYAAIRVGKRSFRPTVECYRPLLGLAIPIGLFALGSQGLLSMDLWVLNALGSEVSSAIKGLYVAALNLARIPNVTAFVATAVMIPSIARARALNQTVLVEQTIQNGLRFLLILILPACGLMAVRAEDVMRLVFSESYSGGGGLLSVLAVAHGLFFTLLTVFCGILIAVGSARQAAILTLSTLPLSAILSATMVTAKGAAGASWAALLATGIGAVTAGILVYREVTPILDTQVFLRILVLTTALCWAVWRLPLGGWRLLLAAVALLSLYAAALPLAGLLSRQDLEPFLPTSRREG